MTASCGVADLVPIFEINHFEWQQHHKLDAHSRNDLVCNHGSDGATLVIQRRAAVTVTDSCTQTFHSFCFIYLASAEKHGEHI